MAGYPRQLCAARGRAPGEIAITSRSPRGTSRKGAPASAQVIINFPVADLVRSVAFFNALGFAHDPQFIDDTAARIVLGDSVSVMLLTHAKFRQFTPKAICDTSTAAEVLITLSCESREQLDGYVAKAIAAGGSSHDTPDDYGFMYTHSFVDPDGHGWGLVHMSATPARA